MVVLQPPTSVKYLKLLSFTLPEYEEYTKPNRVFKLAIIWQFLRFEALLGALSRGNLANLKLSLNLQLQKKSDYAILVIRLGGHYQLSSTEEVFSSISGPRSGV
jgi:hypothetical protein